MLVQARLHEHDAFTIGRMARFRKIDDRDGPTWGIDLAGMPKTVRDGSAYGLAWPRSDQSLFVSRGRRVSTARLPS